MNIFANKIDVNEFGPNNILKSLIAESENIIYLPDKNFDLNVYISDNSDFNAAAYESGNKSYTNLSFACIKQIFHHAFLLMGNHVFLHEAGNEPAYDGSYSILEFKEPEILPYDQKYKQLTFYAIPENPTRYRIAEIISCFGIEFLLFHELGHHLGGHIRYLSKEMGISQLYAYDNSKISLDNYLYQMLETDADAIAISTLLESISTKISFYSELLDNNIYLLPQCIVIALTIVFFLLPIEDSSQYDLTSSLYLPRDTRLYLILDILLNKLENDYSCCKFNQAPHILMKTFHEANALLGELYRDASQKTLINLDCHEYRKHYKDVLLHKWKENRKKLEEYAAINLPI